MWLGCGVVGVGWGGGAARQAGGRQEQRLAKKQECHCSADGRRRRQQRRRTRRHSACRCCLPTNTNTKPWGTRRRMGSWARRCMRWPACGAGQGGAGRGGSNEVFEVATAAARQEFHKEATAYPPNQPSPPKHTHKSTHTYLHGCIAPALALPPRVDQHGLVPPAAAAPAAAAGSLCHCRRPVCPRDARHLSVPAALHGCQVFSRGVAVPCPCRLSCSCCRRLHGPQQSGRHGDCRRRSRGVRAGAGAGCGRGCGDRVRSRTLLQLLPSTRPGHCQTARLPRHPIQRTTPGTTALEGGHLPAISR